LRQEAGVLAGSHHEDDRLAA